MLARQHRNAVRADFVCNIAVGSYTIRTNKNGFNVAKAHKMPNHTVSNQSEGNTLLLQLPCGQTGALKDGASLINEDVNAFTRFVRHIYWSQGSSPTSSGQCTRITMGQKRIAISNQLRAIITHSHTGIKIFISN